MEPLDSDTLIRLLVNIATHQLAITADIRTVLQEQRAINERLEKMLQGLLPPSPNGQKED
jgi:hypothetical protein